jgi:hypothetical protein
MKVRKHSRNVFCKVHSHKWKDIGVFWKCFKCGRRIITRRAFLAELLPGLNALFGPGSSTNWEKIDFTNEEVSA